MVNQGLKEYVASLLDKNLREDGRKLDEFRKDIIIETGISKNAEGSARVKIGETEVVAGVKMDIGEPFPDSPNNGVLIVGAELLPMSSPEFEAGPPDTQTVELARIVDRGLRESECIDLKKLCVREGEKVWIIFVDIYTINDGGNLIDASALAAVAALKDARIPEYDKETFKVKFGEYTKQRLELKNIPIACTMLKINGKIVVDPILNEESVADSRLTVTTTESKAIHAMQKGGKYGLSMEDINHMIDISILRGNELRKLVK